MNKIIASALICIIMIFNFSQIFAAEDEKIITNVSAYTGTLFLSDWKDDSIILTNVKPLIETYEGNVIAGMLEYNEVSAFNQNVWNGSNGEELDLSSLAWFVDMDVKVVVAEMASGDIRVIHISTI